MGLAGLLLLLAALDVVWLHRLSGPPDRNEDGSLTSRGIVQRRSDILWGSVMIVGGSIVLLAAVAGLAVRRPVVELTDDELRLRLGAPLREGGPLATVAVPWEEVVAIRSATDETDGWQPTRVLVLEVEDVTRLPVDPWGAEWKGGALHIDADSWQVPVEEVALRSQLLLVRKARRPTDDDGGTV